MKQPKIYQDIMKPENDFCLSEYLDQQRAVVNKSLEHIMSSFDSGRELIRAMTHSLMAGGKRLRPILCMAAAKASKADPSAALPAACALEFIHTYSLIHDDLPAMDDDDLRRGRPTCHKQFSESTAILAGDALLTHAFYILSAPWNYFDIYPSVDQSIKIMAVISSASGTDGMIEGQILDIASMNTLEINDLETIEHIHRLKTGRLIQASVEAGALSAGADEKVILALIRYAGHIGLAFQVVDDILNVEGNPEIMGKAAGSDSKSNKMTYPAVLGLEQSRKYAGQLVQQAVQALEDFDYDAEPLRQIASFIIDRNH